MFFSSITADYTKMGYPKAIVRALDFLKNTDLKTLPGGRHAIEENMGFFVDKGLVKPVESYPDRDCYFYPNEAVDEGQIHCPEGYYTVFFPSDVHRPLLAVNDKPIKIRKVVVKVHVSLLGD